MITILLFIIGSTIEHEHLHQMIYSRYHIDSFVTYNFIDSFKDLSGETPLAWTTAINTNGTNASCDETCNALHLENEIADTQTMNLVEAMFIIFLLYVLHTALFRRKPAEEVKEEEGIVPVLIPPPSPEEDGYPPDDNVYYGPAKVWPDVNQ